VAVLRREQIVRATIRCLARDGYRSLTMKRVAREAGVTPSILHYYFEDKRAILAAAGDTLLRDLDRRVAAEARGAPDARGRLRALVRACLEVATRDRDFWTVFIELWGQTLHDPRLASLNASAYARARRLIGGLVAGGVAEGAFRAVAPRQAAIAILALLDGVSLQLTFEPRLVSVRRAAQLCEQVLLRYLAPDPTCFGGVSEDPPEVQRSKSTAVVLPPLTRTPTRSPGAGT